jgi:hypothetical protein
VAAAGKTPDDLAARVIAAMEGLTAAKLERDEALAAALNGGGSVREVAMISGMSERQVQNIGHANGWPSAAIKRAREAATADRKAWAAAIDAYQLQPPTE